MVTDRATQAANISHDFRRVVVTEKSLGNIVIGKVEFLTVDLHLERLSRHPFLLRASAFDRAFFMAVSARAA
jgi:hypothetical protein